MQTPFWVFTHKTPGGQVKVYCGWSVPYLRAYATNHNRLFEPTNRNTIRCNRCKGVAVVVAELQFRLFHVWVCRKGNQISTDAVYNGELIDEPIRILKCARCDRNHALFSTTVEGKRVGSTTIQVAFEQHEAKCLPSVKPQELPAYSSDDEIVGNFVFPEIYDD